ncbi:hypothetical protein KKF84_12135 [Myxococcota bacterium]|nr:hypothetical protein [Myxococcota bacterium]MBU1536063.1 hypothetical protein [Myxococcota bacterium]
MKNHPSEAQTFSRVLWRPTQTIFGFIILTVGAAASLWGCAEGYKGSTECVPDCTGYSCGEIEPLCQISCGDRCDVGCTDHCMNNTQDCDEVALDCGGSTCTACFCVPTCAGLDCGDLDPVCNSPCGDPCDAGCSDHCSNGMQDCDETSLDCGGSTCASCNCTPNCTSYSCGNLEPVCSTPCGSICDSGCTAHCIDGTQNCDETGSDCGGPTCSPCTCVPNCSGFSCGQIEPTCGTACGTACDAGCTAHCSNSTLDCDETGTDCGGATCTACVTGGCGDECFVWDGYCDSMYIGGCDGCDMGCGSHDPDCDAVGSTCLSSCPCLSGYSNWYCDGWDDCTDVNCECSGE